MIEIRIEGVDRVVASLDRLGTNVTQRLHKGVEREGIQLARVVKEEKLSGQVLKNRTGRLRRSINARFTATPSSATSTVGTNVVYGRAHEYGFEGTVSVREHVRHLTQVFGHPLAAPLAVSVGAFSRHMHLPERSFLRSALRESAVGIRDRLLADVHAVVREMKP